MDRFLWLHAALIGRFVACPIKTEWPGPFIELDEEGRTGIVEMQIRFSAILLDGLQICC